MRNANEVLRHKEADLARVRNEIEALKMVAPLLAEGASSLSDLTSDEEKADSVVLRNLTSGVLEHGSEQ